MATADLDFQINPTALFPCNPCGLYRQPKELGGGLVYEYHIRVNILVRLLGSKTWWFADCGSVSVDRSADAFDLKYFLAF